MLAEVEAIHWACASAIELVETSSLRVSYTSRGASRMERRSSRVLCIHRNRRHLELFRLAEAEHLRFRRDVQLDWDTLAWQRLGPSLELAMSKTGWTGWRPVRCE